MSSDLVLGLILAIGLLGGVLVITVGFAGAGRPNRRRSSGSEAVFLATSASFDDGGHCSTGDGGGGGSCDGGGGGS
jgi:hypothetical protein